MWDRGGEGIHECENISFVFRAIKTDINFYTNIWSHRYRYLYRYGCRRAILRRSDSGVSTTSDGLYRAHHRGDGQHATG